MRRFTLFSPLIASLVIFGAGVAHPALTYGEDEPTSGRLADGRAFRTDDQGNQLIDYIAELEVSNQSLEERVRGLEGELKSRLAVIEELKAGGRAPQPVREQDLVRSSEQQKSMETDERRVAEQCNRELARVKSTLTLERAQVEESLSAYQGTIRELRARLASPQCPELDCGPETAPLQSRVALLTEELATARGTYERELSVAQARERTLEERLAQSSAELAKVSATLAASAERASPGVEDRPVVASVRSDPTKDLARVLPRDETRASLDRGALAPGVVRASRRPSEPPRPAALVSLSSEAQLSTARERAVQSLRGGLLSELNKTRGWIERRDARYAKFNQRKRAVAFKPVRPVSSQGKGVTEIAEAAKKARSVYELTQLRREMTEIRTRMTDDMALMDRLQ